MAKFILIHIFKVSDAFNQKDNPMAKSSFHAGELGGSGVKVYGSDASDSTVEASGFYDLSAQKGEYWNQYYNTSLTGHTPVYGSVVAKYQPEPDTEEITNVSIIINKYDFVLPEDKTSPHEPRPPRSKIRRWCLDW